MKNNYIVKVLLCVLLTLSGLIACTGDKTQKSQHEHLKGQQYTCPMHPQIIKDEPGKCPICGMALVLKKSNNELVPDSGIANMTKPVNSHVIASIPTIKAETGVKIYTSEINGVIAYDSRNRNGIASRVGGRIERLLIKYNYQPVRKGQLLMEVYSPELAAAQQELLYISKQQPALLESARQRLLLLGMLRAQISQVLHSGKINYRIPVYSPIDGYILESTATGSTQAAVMPATVPAAAGMDMAGDNATPAPSIPVSSSITPVLLREGQYVNAAQMLFTIYKADALVAEFAFPPALAANIKLGQKILFYPVNADSAMRTAHISLIEPVFRNGLNFTIARVYLSATDYRRGQLVHASMPVVYTKGWWLPKKAVWRMGTRSVIFRKQLGVYKPIPIQTGVEAGELIQVLDDIGNWDVAANAAFLVDSESFIKTENTIQQ